MKLIIAAALAAFALAVPAYASDGPVHHRAPNCGWPHPDASCHVPAPSTDPSPTPSPTPAPAPVSSTCSPADLTCVINTLVGIQTDFVTILQQVDAYAGTLNTSSNQAWDPTLLQCLNGTPAQGTPGQNGYVAPQAGLIAWVQGLQVPSFASVPPVVDQNNLAEVAEHARLLVLAGMQDVNTLVSQLQVSGPPTSFMQPCGSFLQNAFIAVPTQIAGQWAAIDTVIVKFFPAAFAHRDARLHAALH
jgi:hypothetical protein